MTTVQAQIPDTVYRQFISLSEKENMPADQLMSYALIEAIGAWTAQSAIQQRARRGSRTEFEKALAQVPDVEPEEYDKL